MFILLRFIPRIALRAWLVLLSAAAGLAVAGVFWLRRLQRTWGVVPGDVDRSLPGDEIVPDADIVETRSLAIDAPPAEVWPWLVQMGYGRGGWYSFDKLDMKGSSADHLMPEFQELAEGDLVPTHPGGGFVARLVERDAALVLYLDTELVHEQMESAVAEHGADALEGTDESESVGLQFAGAMGDMTMPEFRATWAFSLQPEPDGSTRLIERMRLSTADAGLPGRLGMPFMGLGVFAMTRKHMLGLKERAERPSGNGASAPAEPRTA